MATIAFLILIFIVLVIILANGGYNYLRLKSRTESTPTNTDRKSLKKNKDRQKNDKITLSAFDDKKRKDKEWARKMADCREQKKIALFKNFSDVGAKLVSVKDKYIYHIISPENISIASLFKLYEGNCWQCDFTDITGEKLLHMSLMRYSCKIEFFQEIKDPVILKKDNVSISAEKFLFCYFKNRTIKRTDDFLNNIIKYGLDHINGFIPKNINLKGKIEEILISSFHELKITPKIDVYIDANNVVIDYELPNISFIPTVKEYTYFVSTNEIREKRYTDKYINSLYEKVIYSIVLRSIHEVFYVDAEKMLQAITFNGFVTNINPYNGIMERKCILSIQVSRDAFSNIDLINVNPKLCFKGLKGVSASRLIDITPITPILTFNKADNRFIEGKLVDINQGTNLAAMHWEDFEHLVRELFEMEFAKNGGEVRVTQASRDGGVDAIIFDPDPLRGGKIVVQAKRYTNTVGVSAVRDLYGTVINEGANTGILITTSDYGHDSYEFAKDKPLKLLNGGHLLALLHKNGRSAHINIEEAKKIY